MNNDYEAFCMADPVFYDSPDKAETDKPYALSERDAPAQWRRDRVGHWTIYSPLAFRLPMQGWKVHVAGRLDNAQQIIETAWDYCIAHKLTFKFLTSPRIVLARNAKYAGRGGSGKLVTIYPRDEDQLRSVCEDLEEKLAGQAGPYILSDLRWGAGPVHVRYGGFTPRYCLDERAVRVLAIEDPTGQLVPDKRDAVFSVPAWVPTPAFLAPHLEARSATTVGGIPYDIEQALHFSNGGGVYRGRDKSSDVVVILKEARPHAGLSGDGIDAVARLRSERDALERLAGIAAVPRLLDYLTIGEHEFLVMEYVEGEPLNAVLSGRSPMLDSAADEDTRAAHADWARELHDAITAVIAQIHDRGVVYGDLHPFNILIRPDGSPTFIDFEVADDVGSGRRPTLGAPGYVSPPDRYGFDIDLYALACLQLSMFVPLERLIGIDRAKAAHVADIVEANFPVERAWLDRAVAVIRGPSGNGGNGENGENAGGQEQEGRVGRADWREGRRHQQVHRHWQVEPTVADWCRVRRSLTEGILASATPGRDDRLFPGDILQFEPGGGLGFAHGAAGVLYALAITGAGQFPEHEDWLVRHALDAGPDVPLGFYDGLHGVAYALERLGRRTDAMKILDRCLAAEWEAGSDDLNSGVAGIGLNLAEMSDAFDDAALEAGAERATQLLADRLGTVEDVPEVSGGVHPLAGLLRGSAGKALLFVRMYERTGAPALLDHASTALRQDLRRCVIREKGGQLHVNEGWRTLPYMGVGSVGIGLVLRRYLTHRDDDEIATAAAAIRGAACSPFYIQSGLFGGRAGMVLYLADAHRRSDPADLDPDLADQVRRLSWHALDYEGHLAYPGDQLLRLSMDLATGSAGVLLALGSALHDEPVGLPFLAAPAPAAAVRVQRTPVAVLIDDTRERR